MKPRTKLQKRIMRLKSRLPAITERKRQWVKDQDQCGTYIKAYSSKYCLECGHKWKASEPPISDELLNETCAGCKKDLRQYKFDWTGSETENGYWASIHVVKEFQVVRIIRVRKFMKRGQPAQYDHQEVMQHWITPEGIIETLSGRCQGMGYYYDSWIPGSEMEVRGKSHSHYMRQSINPDWIYPHYNVQPIIKRNGFKGSFFDEAPHYVFSSILQNPKAETLLKSGQISMFKKICGRMKDVDPKINMYWPSICIAIRNGYYMAPASDWLDYIRLLDNLGNDIRNPKYVCPPDLNKAHNAANRKYMNILAQRAKEKQMREIEEHNAEYTKKKAAFIGLAFDANGFTFKVLSSVHEFKEESDQLKHCIFTNRYYDKDGSLILSAQKEGQRLETVEIDLTDLKVSQARGLNNKATEYHDLIVDGVNQNINLIAQRLSA